jgi:hypothetical protein
MSNTHICAAHIEIQPHGIAVAVVNTETGREVPRMVAMVESQVVGAREGIKEGTADGGRFVDVGFDDGATKGTPVENDKRSSGWL